MFEGKCPHITSNVPKDWILETCVTTAHVAVATGTRLEKDKDLRGVYRIMGYFRVAKFPRFCLKNMAIIFCGF